MYYCAAQYLLVLEWEEDEYGGVRIRNIDNMDISNIGDSTLFHGLSVNKYWSITNGNKVFLHWNAGKSYLENKILKMCWMNLNL